MDDLSNFCCQNLQCPNHGQRGAGNLAVSFIYGKFHRRMLICRTCRARFSERKGTPLFQAHLPEAQAIQVFEHLAEGCGVRQTGRLTGVHRDTVGRLARLAGDHAKALHDELVAFSPSNPGAPVR